MSLLTAMKTLSQMTFMLLTALLIFTVISGAGGQGTDQFSVRLVEGGSDLGGRVELFVDGKWGIICDSDWSYADAAVVCRQLGFGGPIAALGSAQFGPGGTNIVLKNVECEGSESTLFDCPSKNDTSCSSDENVGVICSNGTVQPVPYSLRIVDHGHYYKSAHGRVEVYIDGAWEAVCADGWDINDATVVCRQLGYEGDVTARDLSPDGNRDAFFYDVACSGSESSFEECPMTTNYRYCSDDAGVECRGNNTKLPSEYSVRLLDDRSSSDFLSKPNTYLAGRVDVFIGRAWARTCYNELDMAAATVICRQLGYGWPISITRSKASHTLTYKARLDCTGAESSLGECSVTAPHDCAPGQNSDGVVICSGSDHQELVLRLVNHGGDPLYGTVEAYVGDEWGSICPNGWSFSDAQVVCRQLGYGEALSTRDLGSCCSDAHFDDVSCSGSESNLLQCPLRPNEDCGKYDSKASVVCSNLRLVGGDSDWAGTVEVYYDNQWNTICGDGWDLSDATVVCRQLSQLRLVGSYRATAYYANARFGPGSGRVVMSEVGCRGTENWFLDCPLSYFFETECPHSKDVGVECEATSTPIQNYTVRLSGGASSSEGRVEFYFDDQWYTVCADGWDTAASLALCRQLGYAGADVYNSSLSYGEGTGRPIGGVKCYGEEEELSECKVLWDGCATRNEASARCTDTSYTTVLGAVRLPSSLSETQGRVEVFYDGEWGTICDEGWSDEDADVICRELGFEDHVGKAMHGGYFEPGDGPVFLSNVSCSGNEKRLVYCAHGGWRKVSCGHDRDAGVVCTRPPSTDHPNIHRGHRVLVAGVVVGICVAGAVAIVGCIVVLLCLIKYCCLGSSNRNSAGTQASSAAVYYSLPKEHASDPSPPAYAAVVQPLNS